MYRFVALVFLASAAWADGPLPNPEILKWQAEAQARERAINRRVEHQLAQARTAPAPAGAQDRIQPLPQQEPPPGGATQAQPTERPGN